MTTLVQTRQPLQVLSMSNQPKRRRSERIACRFTGGEERRDISRLPTLNQGKRVFGLSLLTSHVFGAAYDESDDDFHFTRKSKKIKTVQPEPIPEDEPVPAPAPAPKSRKTAAAPAPRKTRSKQSKEPEAPPQPPPKRTSKRKSSQLSAEDESSPPPPPPPPPPQPAQRTTRRKARASVERTEKEQPKTTNGASTRGRRKQVPAAPEPEPEPEPELEADAIAEVEAEEQAAQSTPMDIDKAKGPDNSSNSKKIALPFSDTPIINRNKEMRKKTGSRRSSLGMRGRRASSLIDSGHSAIPHREVDSAEFYKHIEADGPSEPRRMKQLMTWCGERALAKKPKLGSLNSNAILGGKENLSQRRRLRRLLTFMSQLERFKTSY